MESRTRYNKATHNGKGAGHAHPSQANPPPPAAQRQPARTFRPRKPATELSSPLQPDVPPRGDKYSFRMSVDRAIFEAQEEIRRNIERMLQLNGYPTVTFRAPDRPVSDSDKMRDHVGRLCGGPGGVSVGGRDSARRHL